MLVYCWATVADGGPTLNQHRASTGDAPFLNMIILYHHFNLTTSFVCHMNNIRAECRGAVHGLSSLLEKSEIACSTPTLAFKFQRNKMFLPCSLAKIKYCGKFPLPKGSQLSLRLLGLKFRILSLEGSVISFISPSS